MEKNRVNVPGALTTSVAAGSAFLLTTWLDSTLSRHPYNDLKLVGQMFTTKSPLWQIQGLVGHYSFSAVMLLVYASWAYNRLPGPPWLRGVLFVQIENSLLYPVAPILDKFHAGVRHAQLPPLLNWKTFFGQMLRHVVYGFVLGALYRPNKG